MLVLCDKYQGELNGQLMAGVSDVTSGKTKQAKDSIIGPIRNTKSQMSQRANSSLSSQLVHLIALYSRNFKLEVSRGYHQLLNPHDGQA